MMAGNDSTRAARWFARLAFAAPLAWNLQCIISLLTAPAESAVAFGLTGTAGTAAVQGLAVAFLMWNATYPLFIYAPVRFKELGIIVAVQQLIGLVGETLILFSLPANAGALIASIQRFIVFDAAGLVLMVAALIVLFASLRRSEARK